MKKAIVFLLFLSACTYKYKMLVIEDLDSLRLTPFENRIKFSSSAQSYSHTQVYPTGLEDQITEFLKKEILAKTNLKLSATSQTVLEGYIKKFERLPLTYNKVENVNQYRIVCVCRVILTQKGKVILDKDVSQDFVFSITGEDAIDFLEAQTKLAERLAKEIVRIIKYRW